MRCSIAAALLCLVSFTAEAKQSPYPPVTSFNGDRYAGIAQLGPEVARSVQRQRASKNLNRATAAQRKHGRRIPMPRPRPGMRQIPIWAPLAEPGAVEPLSVAGGVWREAGRVAGRPARWCGWWLSHHLGMPSRDLWLARNWAKVGSSAGGPKIGAIVVWPHHVGIITGRQNGMWVVKSGNDGRAVRERPRSVAGAIAFRLPSS